MGDPAWREGLKKPSPPGEKSDRGDVDKARTAVLVWLASRGPARRSGVAET